ncbi:MAG: S41 family peptidase [Saprospiraceae bacterium]|jgi:hypothetical protein|nr:S41 family peptidase [Saprospiraceae bacterium]
MTSQIVAIILTFQFFISSTFAQKNVAPNLFYSTNELKADLKYLKNKLESKHPGLHLYTSKSNMDQVFDSLENGISKPMTELEFYKHIAIISSMIKDGHTIILPSPTNINFHYSMSHFLPYHFAILNHQLFIDMVYTHDGSIPIGSEIIRINHVEVTEIIKQLGTRLVRDGYNLTYPNWILNNYFRQYYSFIYDHPDNYVIDYKTNGQVFTATIKALPIDSIFYYRQKHYPNKTFSNLPNDGLKLNFINENNYAILTIKDFHNDVLKKDYKQNFKSVIALFFEQIKNSQTENLILDLRNNQGGDIENGVYLLSYLLDKPFSIVQKYYRVDKNKLKQCKGPSLGQHIPESNPFKGKLYVLINGGSFSNSGIVASCLQSNHRATFIGQETGGNPHVIAGFTKDITLPNTKIQVQIPTKQFVITDKLNNDGHGVIPNHIVEPILKDILENKDTVLDYTINLINKSKKNE